MLISYSHSWLKLELWEVYKVLISFSWILISDTFPCLFHVKYSMVCTRFWSGEDTASLEGHVVNETDRQNLYKQSIWLFKVLPECCVLLGASSCPSLRLQKFVILCLRLSWATLIFACSGYLFVLSTLDSKNARARTEVHLFLCTQHPTEHRRTHQIIDCGCVGQIASD